MKKKLLMIALGFCICLCLTPAMAFAANEAGQPEAVAEINGVSYSSVNDAFAAVEDGQTITLLKSVDGVPQILVNGNKKITLDLNGCTLSGIASQANQDLPTYKNQVDYFIGIASGSTLVVADSSAEKNGALQASASRGSGTGDKYIKSTVFEVAGTLQIDGGNLKLLSSGIRTNTGYGIHSTSECNVVINQGNFLAENKDVLFYLKASSGEVAQLLINGGNFTSTGSYYGIYAYNVSMTVTDGEFNKSGKQNLFYGYQATNLTISGGTYNCSATSDMFKLSGSNSPAHIDINGGTFNYTNTGSGSIVSFSGESTSMNINGGVFNSASSKSIVSASPTKTMGYTISDGIFNCSSTDWFGCKGMDGGQFKTKFPSVYCGQGKIVTSEPVDGYYSVISMTDENAPVILKNGNSEQSFNSVEGAIEYAKDTGHPLDYEIIVCRDTLEDSIKAYVVGKVTVNPGVNVTSGDVIVSYDSVSESRNTLLNKGSISCKRIAAPKSGKGYFVNEGTVACDYIDSHVVDCVNKGQLTLGVKSSSSPSDLNNFVNSGTIIAPNGYKVNVVGKDVTINNQSLSAGFVYVYNDETQQWDASADVSVVKDGKVVAVADNLADAYGLAVEKSADTLKLGNNVENPSLSINTKITLDLNGYSLNYGNISLPSEGIINIQDCGDITIKDSSITTAPVVNDDGTITYSSGKIYSSFGKPAVSVKAGGKLTLESGTIEGNNDMPAIYIGSAPIKDPNTPEQIGSPRAVVTINGGLVANNDEIAAEGDHSNAIEILGTGTDNNPQSIDPLLVVNDGVVASKNGTAIIGQGRFNNTQISIKGGTVLSQNSSAIYHPQYGTLDITGGVIKGHSGVIIKGGNANIGGNAVVSAFGAKDYPSEPYGSGCALTGDALYVEDNYGRSPVVVVSGGTFTSKNATAVNKLFAPSDTSKKPATIEITAGGFSSDPSDFVKEGFVAAKSDTGFAVSPRNDTSPEVPAPSHPEAIVPQDGNTQKVIDAAEQVEVVLPQDNLTPLESEKTAAESLEKREQDILFETYLSIEVKGYSDAEVKSLKLGITPKTVAVVDCDGVKVPVGEAREFEVDSVVKVTIPLPEGFASVGDTLFVVHTKDSSTEYVYQVVVKSDESGLFVEFDNPHGFSDFEVTNTGQAVVDYVEGLINGIGEVTYSETSKAKIDAARAAYDALPAADRDRVANYAILTQAEETYNQLKADAEASHNEGGTTPSNPSDADKASNNSKPADNGKSNTSESLAKTNDGSAMLFIGLVCAVVTTVMIATVATRKLSRSKN